MGKRHTGRKLAMQALYQAELRQEALPDFIEEFLDEAQGIEDTINWARDLAMPAWEAKDTADEQLKSYLIDWNIDRLNLIDKSILRLAFYELLQTDSPNTVIVNEAVELAKQYSTDESPKFINGVLGKYIEDQCSQDSSKA